MKDRKRKKGLAILLLCAAFVGQTFAETQTDDDFIKQREADNKLCEFLPKLAALGEKYQNDAEIQLGLASLYRRASLHRKYGDPHVCSGEEQYKKVLAIDPNNQPAWAISTKLSCWGYTAKRNAILDDLERRRNYAKKHNIEELKIPKRGSLYKWFKEEGKDAVVIKDFDLAAQQLREKLDEEVPTVLDMLNNGQNKDPENALYNYLRAHLYFELGEKDKAIREIRDAAAKEYFNNYFKETREATARVLREVDFPEHQRSFITDRHTIFADFLRSEIWKEGLAELGKSYEAQGDFDKAEEMYRLTTVMAKQIKEEPLPYPSHYNQTFGQHLENWADQRTEKLYKKMSNQAWLERAKYSVIGALCAILVIGVVLLVKKKASSRGK